MAFFHTTPLGRIINRLTKDTVDVDKNLADFAAFFLRSLLQLVSTIVLIGVVVPFALPALLPILLLFYFLYQYFQARRLAGPPRPAAPTAPGAAAAAPHPCVPAAPHAAGSLLCFAGFAGLRPCCACDLLWYFTSQPQQITGTARPPVLRSPQSKASSPPHAKHRSKSPSALARGSVDRVAQTRACRGP